MTNNFMRKMLTLLETNDPFESPLWDSINDDSILLENRIDFLKNGFLPRIESYIAANPVNQDVAPKINREPGESEPEKIFNYVVSHDPDTNKKYSRRSTYSRTPNGLLLRRSKPTVTSAISNIIR